MDRGERAAAEIAEPWYGGAGSRSFWHVGRPKTCSGGKPARRQKVLGLNDVKGKHQGKGAQREGPVSGPQ